MVFQKHLVGAGGYAVDGVVGAHDRLHVRVNDGGAEGGKVGLFEIARADINIEAVAQGFGPAVDGVVLAGGDSFGMLGIGTLYTRDECVAHSGGEEWVLAVGLLAAAPARIAEDVDVRRPEGQSVEDAA